MQDIKPAELHEWLRQTPAPYLLDVRELWEFEYAHIDGSVHIPMGEVPQRHRELVTDEPIIVICHHGVRSRQVALYLEQLGYTNIYNLWGGIHAWSCEVDSKVPIY